MKSSTPVSVPVVTMVISEPLRKEFGFESGYTIFTDSVRLQIRDSWKMLAPLIFGQADFGGGLVNIAGVDFFALDLSLSNVTQDYNV